MKTEIALEKALLVAALCLFLAGCGTPGSSAGNTRRFHEGSRVDAVLQFSSWDYTFLVKPRYDENGFLRQVRRDNLSQVLERFNVSRGLAVVVIGWSYGPKELDELVAAWKNIMGGCGFRRVVFLRSNAHNELNGSLVIDDSTLSLASAQTGMLLTRAVR
jgi:hypothetical protein